MLYRTILMSVTARDVQSVATRLVTVETYTPSTAETKENIVIPSCIESANVSIA